MFRGLLRAIVVLTLLASAGAQQHPRLPFIDNNACASACCRFGTWTAIKPVSVFNHWQRGGRTRLFVLKQGQAVTAITGVYVTYAPGHIKLLQDMPDVRLRKGAVLETYMPVDED